MTNEKKYCSQCGESMERDVKFCANCGFNFNSKEPIENRSEQTPDLETSEKTSFKFSKKHLLIGGVLIAVAIVVSYFAFGNTAIAGTYSNGSEIIEIERDGKMTVMDSSQSVNETLKISFYLKEDKDQMIYLADPNKDIEIEVSVSREEYFWDGSADSEVEYMIEMFGFEKKEVGDRIIISGNLTSEQAYLMDMMDLSIFTVEEYPEGIYVVDEFFERQ